MLSTFNEGPLIVRIKADMKKFFKPLIFQSYRYFPIMFVLFIALLGYELYFLKNNFNLNSNLKALFAGETETVKDLNYLESRVGTHTSVLVIAKSDSLDKNLKVLKLLKKNVEKSPLVRFVDLEHDIDYLKDRSLLFLSEEKLLDIKNKVRKSIAKEVQKKLALDDDDSDNSEKDSIKKEETLEHQVDDIIEKINEKRDKYEQTRFMSADDGKMVAMKIRPTKGETDINETKEILDFVNSTIKDLNPAKYGVELEAGGDFSNKLKEKKAVESDLISTLTLCIFLLSLTIIFYFRSFSALVIILLPLTIGVVSAISVSQVIVGEFNIISAFSFAMLYGLGIDFGIHLLSRYSEQRVNVHPVRALCSTYASTLPSILSGALTTAIAFFVLIFIEFRGFSDFGLVAGVGIITSLTAIILFFPPLIFVFEKFFSLKVRARQISIIERVYKVLSKKTAPTLIITGLLLILASISLFMIELEYNMNNLSFPHKTSNESLNNQFDNKVNDQNRDVMAHTLPGYIITNSLEETRDISNQLDEILEKKPFEIDIDKYVSVYSFVPDKQEKKLKIIKRIKRLINRKKNLFADDIIKKIDDKLMPLLSVTTKVEMNKLPDWILNKLREKNGNYGNIVKIAFHTSKANILNSAIIKRDYQFIKTEKKTYKVTAIFFLLSDIKDAIEKDVPLAIIAALFAVLFTLIITFRSLKTAGIIMVPLIFGMILMIGAAWLVGMKMNIFNMVVIPTVVGIGIDSGIHIYHRFKIEGIDRLSHILKHTGGAVLFSSITTFVGFASLAFAGHRGLKSIGTIAAIGIITVTGITLIVFPIVIKAIHKKKN